VARRLDLACVAPPSRGAPSRGIVSAGDAAEHEVPTVTALRRGTHLENEMSLRTFSVLGRAMLAASVGSIFAPGLRAQALRLRVTEEASGRPVAGAVAEVLDNAGTVVAQGVLQVDGRRVIVLPAGGAYRVRIRRIGFEPFSAAAPVVPPTGTVDLALALPARRVVLNTITVLARPLCSRDAFRDAGVSALWTEIRTALASTYLSRTDSTFSLEARAFRRQLDPSLEPRAEQVGLPRVTGGTKPYVSLDADSLASEGYVRRVGQENVFYAPDEQVLLSDRFVEEHCFQVARGEGQAEGLFGLQFSPAKRRNVNDIAGTLWVDSSSAELRYLDFWYVNDRFPYGVLGEGRSGGQVLFGRIPNGMWIVSAWRLRMPRFADGTRLTLRSSPDGYEEFGGVVSSLAVDSLMPFGIAHPYRDLLVPARISGVVFDSLSNAPLPGARVWLLPEETNVDVAAGLAPPGGRLAAAPVEQLTDVRGQFAFVNLPAGSWRVAFEHRRLDSVGVRAPFYDVRFRPGAAVSGVLAVPSLGTLELGCMSPSGPLQGPQGGMIAGLVRAAGDDRALVGALVRATWIDLRRAATLLQPPAPTTVEAHTDSLGEYRICGIPDSVVASVVAAGPHSSTGEVQAVVGPLGIVRVNLRLAEVAEGELAPRAGTLTGTVTDSLGAPVSGAQVALDGDTSSVRTDAAGKFRLAEVRPGTQTIEVRRLGLEPARLVVDIAPGTSTTVALTLIRSRLLDPILVTAERMKHLTGVVDAIQRHRTGIGTMMLADEIAQRPTIMSLLQGISGVRVMPEHGGIEWVAMMRRGAGECAARTFVDGREVDTDFVASLSPRDLAAVEVYVRGATAPIFTAGRSPYGRDEACGVILFWEKH